MSATAPARSRSSAAALADGCRRTFRAPLLVLGLWSVAVLFSLPLALAVKDAIAEQLGASLEANTAADAADYDWLQEFNAQSSGAAVTLTADVIGFAAVLENASAFLDRKERPVLVAAAIVLYLGMLTFLAGGCIDRLARDRPVPAHAFFAACGAWFPRFLKLAVAALVAYGAILGPYANWIFDDLLPKLTRDMTAERSVFFAQLAGYAALLAPLAAINVLFDYAKVRAVVEDRRSMLLALIASAAFLRRHARSVLALYVLNVLILNAVLAAYALVAPGAGDAGFSMWAALLIGQAYIAARGAVKLIVWASESALFQSRFEHAGWVRRALPAWPESPAVEALGR